MGTVSFQHISNKWGMEVSDIIATCQALVMFDEDSDSDSGCIECTCPLGLGNALFKSMQHICHVRRGVQHIRVWQYSAARDVSTCALWQKQKEKL